MQLPVRMIIYFYIFICVALLLFNLLYIFRSSSMKRKQAQKVQRWKKYFDSLQEGAPQWETDKVLRRLKSTEELIAFNTTLENEEQEHPGMVASYFRENRELVLRLVEEYGRKAAMEQAFMAYVIATFHPPIGDERSQLLELLLGYLENSTVYSRENVLNALYVLGNGQSVEHAFTLISQRGWYHDSRLLSDGLNRFQGNRDALVDRLWKSRAQLSECFQVGVVRFADTLRGNAFAEEFLQAMETEELPEETRFAMVRYFRRHVVPEAKPVLLQLLQGDAEGKRELAIAAATTLVSYPDSETRQALTNALHSQNWYVRQNAARSLKAMGVTWEEIQVSSGGDRYATEMLEYVYNIPSTVSAGQKKGSEALAAV